MPPPNVTGELHLGHGLEDAITDALVRWRRMRGFAALWLPGEDHAGIATQNVMERELAAQGIDRRDMGREAFVERTWEWVRRIRPRIAEQHRKLGASADWSRDAFTLDPGIVRAVRTTFVNLYRDGLVYRGLRMINWCPRCATALSDLEVDYVEEEAALWYVRYPVVGEGGMALPEAITVATVRPETMVADTGVAVHPDDERYEDRIGRAVLLPVVGRELPVVADEAIRPDFGTGALKVTPGHDPLDWDIGQRHGLDAIVAVGRDGRMTEEAGPYAGMTVDEARAAIVRDLADGGFLEREEPLRPQRGPLQPLRGRHRAPARRAVVGGREPRVRARPFARGGRRGRRARGPHPRRAPAHGPRLPQLDRLHARLVHQPPALVGPPDPRLVLRLRRDHRAGGRPRRLPRLRKRRPAPGRGRAGHLVLLRPRAPRRPRLARRRR